MAPCCIGSVFICGGRIQFQALLRTADPRYLPPSRIDVAMKALPQRYNQIRGAVLGEVAGVVNCGVSTDLWQSQTQNRTYYYLPVHALSEPKRTRFRFLHEFQVPVNF
jgi:hypothetical protein